MQDQKNSSSIFSFSTMQVKLIKGAFLFFAPIIILMVLIEFLTLQMPSSYLTKSTYFKNEKENISIMTLGSSQMNSAVNPEYIDGKAISLASRSQNHDLDFAIYSQLSPKMNNLKTVVFELSFAHLELPHNGSNSWKNSIYLKYYDVNAFDRNTYFKDKLVYLSNPDIYSRLLINHYINGEVNEGFNKYGFDTINDTGFFKQVHYDLDIIKKTPFHIRNDENPAIFKNNSAFFFKMLDYATANGSNIVIATLPLNKEYLKARNPNSLRRRDSILKIVEQKYPNLRIFRKEEDTVHFNVRDFINHNHLNPSGAKKYSTLLNAFIEESFPN